MTKTDPETVVIQLDERARQLISWAALVESKYATRPAVRGAGLSPDGRMYVTDGHRMHVVRLTLRGMLSQTIHFSHDDLQALAATPYSEVTVWSDGQDPIDYECVIPKEPKHALTFRSASKLRATLNRVKTQIKEPGGYRSAGVALFPVPSSSGGGIALHREGGEGRGGKDILPATACLEGVGSEDAPLLKFDLRYLREAIQLVEGEVRLAFNGSLDPGVIGDLATGDYLAVVMPKRSEDEDAIRTVWYDLYRDEQRRRTA